MEVPAPRPLTPPPCLGLLTPPSTGGFEKRVSFARPQETTFNPKRRAKTKEGESLSEFFEEYNEGSDNEVDTSTLLADDSSISSEEGCLTGVTSTPLISDASRPAIFEKHDSPASVTPVIDATTSLEPFPFFKLPLSIRNKIYEHLLVVPALICVRQKHTAFHDEKKAFLYAERRELLPGIAYALAQTKVDGPKTRFSRFQGTNLNILRVSKEVHTEARSIMYGMNNFDIVKPTDELTPQPNFSVRLFPSGYQRLVTKLNIRIRTFYGLHWVLNGGYNVIKNYYRGLSSLTLILEMDTATKGFGRQWARKNTEKWTVYIQRLRPALAKDLFGDAEPTPIPTWINLRVLFSGEAYDTNSHAPTDTISIPAPESIRNERTKRDELRSALPETWELFKKGGK